jgi:hypothetical protein
MGRALASSAQSKCRGTGAECSGTELGGGTAGDRGCETTVVGGPDGSAVVENMGSGETARLRLSWGELGDVGRFWGWAGKQRGVGGELGCVGDATGCC